MDIIDNRVEPIPFRKLETDKLVFLEKNSFDSVLINFVLHHCKNPVELLKESKRVTRDVIILYENVPDGFLSKFFCMLHGVSFACLFQKNSNKGKFFTMREWEEVFKRLGLKLVLTKQVSSWFNPLRSQLFVLKKGV